MPAIVIAACPKFFNPSIRRRRRFTPAVILLDDIVEILAGAQPFGAPAFRRGRFELDQPADSFLDVSSLGKGTLWVNGHHLGRFWNIGPQRALYLPAVWLKRGANEVIAFDLMPGARPVIRGLTEPLFDEPAVCSSLPLGVCCATCHGKGEAHGLGPRQARKSSSSRRP
jgi:hypothetical protein